MADDPCEAAFGSADPTGARNYYRARYYDPKTGRFIGEDPIGYGGGLNFYSYVFNNPTNLTDPHGKIGVIGGIAIVAGGVLVVTGAYVAITAPEAFWPWVTAVVTGPQLPGSEAAAAATAGPEAAAGAAAIVDHYERDLPAVLCDTEPWKSTDPNCRKADPCEDEDGGN
jgi:RHS repeat-associated protein